MLRVFLSCSLFAVTTEIEDLLARGVGKSGRGDDQQLQPIRCATTAAAPLHSRGFAQPAPEIGYLWRQILSGAEHRFKRPPPLQGRSQLNNPPELNLKAWRHHAMPPPLPRYASHCPASRVHLRLEPTEAAEAVYLDVATMGVVICQEDSGSTGYSGLEELDGFGIRMMGAAKYRSGAV